MPKKKKKASRQLPVRPSSKFGLVLASSSISSARHVVSAASVLSPPGLSGSGLVEPPLSVLSDGSLSATPGEMCASLVPSPVLNPPSSAISVEAMCSLTSLPVSNESPQNDVAPVSEISSAGTISLISGSSPTAGASLINHNSSVNTMIQSFADVAKSSPKDLPWASKFKNSLRNLKQMDPPSFLEDGTPVVVAPPSVLLKTASMWKGHLIAQFHGLCPPSKRIFNDLNPIWGKFGNITVRLISETAALIFIPSLTTRQWVVDIGFWHAGNCSCTVYPWSPEGPLELEDLQTAPTWAVLKNVPPQLYSLEGISVIASGIGEPLHTEKSRLDPINIGITKVKVIIKLDSVLPTTVVVRDIHGSSARVAVEYPRPPPKCLNCGRFGHLISRCPKPLMKKPQFKRVVPAGSKEVTYPEVVLPPGMVPAVGKGNVGSSETSSSKGKRRRSRSKRRANSLPPRINVPQLVDKGKKVMEFAPVLSKKWVAKTVDNHKDNHKEVSPLQCDGFDAKGSSSSASSHLIPLARDGKF